MLEYVNARTLVFAYEAVVMKFLSLAKSARVPGDIRNDIFNIRARFAIYRYDYQSQNNYIIESNKYESRGKIL